jgi:hypothetical protein
MAKETSFMGWVGYLRQKRRQPWRPVVEGGSEDETWDQLLNYPAQGDKCVLPVGRDPNQDRVLR